MTTFDTLGLAEPIRKAITSGGYTTPTPIQAKDIPSPPTGRDVIGIAQTGTGKVAAFVLPRLNRMARETVKPASTHAIARILTPRRELAAQIVETIRTDGQFCKHWQAVAQTWFSHAKQPRELRDRLC